MSSLHGGEGEQTPVADVLQLHGGEVPGQAVKASQPRCAEDDVDVVAYVEKVGINVEDVGVDVKWYTEGCDMAGNLGATTDKYGGVDPLLLEANEADDVDVDDVVHGAPLGTLGDDPGPKIGRSQSS